jgi:hypothetical protein
MSLTGDAAGPAPGPAKPRFPEPPSQQAAKVLRIFSQYCAECHGAKQPRAGLSVLNYSLLIKEERYIVPKKPNDSALLQLVECGTMPPGTKAKVPNADQLELRQWIDSGAVPLPGYGEAFVLKTILNDVRSLDPGTARRSRYLSLNHFLPDGEADLAAAKDTLDKTLRYFSYKNAPVHLSAVDPCGTIFRLDLHELGWDEQPYPKVQGIKFIGKVPDFNFFDLVLLEYPFATIPEQSAEWNSLATEYLQLAKPCRPIVYVHADWFIHAALMPPLASDLMNGLREADPPPDIAKVKVRQPSDLPANRRLFPLDGVTYPNHNTERPPVQFDLEVVDATSGKPQRIFRDGDKFYLRLENQGKQRIYFELMVTNIKGEKTVFNRGEDPVLKRDCLEPKESLRFPDEDVGPLPIKGLFGKEQITVFASASEFPKGTTLDENNEVTDRVLHDFYPLTPNGERFNPSRLLKKTVEIETKPIPTPEK